MMDIIIIHMENRKNLDFISTKKVIMLCNMEECNNIRYIHAQIIDFAINIQCCDVLYGYITQCTHSKLITHNAHWKSDSNTARTNTWPHFFIM